MCIWEYPREDAEYVLKMWLQENRKRLNEKNEKWWFVHIRTRKAYKTMKKKLEYCYVYIEHKKLGIPSTNNSLESINSHLKTKVWIHRWLKEFRKDKVITYFLWFS